MNEPSGPLPPEVYWRRRLLATGVAVVAVAVVIGLIIWASSSGNDDDSSTTNAAASSSSPASSPPASSAPAAPAESKTSAPQPPAQSSSAAPARSGAPTTTSPPPPAEGANGVPCSDQAISVVLYTDKPTYAKGDQPVFTLVTTNGGLAPCSRDVGKAAQNVVVRSLDGTRTLWAAQDCAPDKTVKEQVLGPGQQVTDTVTWSGTTSSPGCDKPRAAIPVGAYQAIAKLGAKESAPITFNVIAPPQR
ncbi:MAG: hypothetical protein QM809_06760 [Gordonia sp. (in: high G+C Gram-positive bacteria)]|uniref:hypothetical protein n=1 Tax=Gordonia sp. (in: high G+C Gram-positive bacteria) TaxID=84139 RepID=UPI0039E5C5B3